MKHINRKLSLEIVSIFVALVLCAGGFLAWRIASGPTSIDFLKPVVEAVFHARTGIHLKLKHLTIAANGTNTPVAITAQVIVVTANDGAMLGSIDDAVITVSRHGLLAGDVHPVALTIDRPIIVLQPAAPQTKAPQQPSGNFLSTLNSPKQGGTLSRWESLSIQNGSLQKSDGAPLIENLGVKLDRTAVGVKGTVHGSYQAAIPSDINGAIEINQGQSGAVQVTDARIDLDLGGPKINATATADTTDGKIKLVGDVHISDLPIDRFAEFWPADVSQGGRRWVLGHLSKGIVEKASAHIAASAPRADPTALDVSSFDGSMNVSGATVKYFGQLPEVKNASAAIDYNKESMTIHMTGGEADGLKLKDGAITLNGFSAHEQTIKIDIDLSGPVSGALDLVDHAPLGYAKKLGLKPADFGGTADTRLQMNFPLIDSVTVEQLNLTTASDLHDVSLPGAVAGKDLNKLNGNLWIGMGGLELIGDGALLDIPLTLDYRQSFEKNGPTIALFSGVTDNRQRAELGFDFPDRLAGKVGVAGKYTAQGNTGSVDMSLDLTPAIFAIDEIGYSKPEGQAGSAKFMVNLKKGEVRSIDPITVEAPEFAANGSAEFTDGKLTALMLDSLKADKTDMKVTVMPADGGGSKIDVSGSKFDARRFLHKKREKETIAAAPLANPAPLQITVNLAKIITSDTNGLTDVKGQLDLLGRKWQRADFTANANGSAVFLSYLPDSADPQPSYTLKAGAADAGAAFSGFALTGSIKGGALVLTGAKPAPTEDQPNPSVSGNFALTSFNLENAPTFARLLNLLSVTGFSKAVSNSAIHFDFFKGSFAVDNGAVKIADGRLRGDAIGLTIAGTVDRDNGTLDLYGTAVPAYGANRMLNAIPLIGPLLTGGEGQGVFAATYNIRGAVENPTVSVNPLSAFAPGVLRDLLFGTSDPDLDSAN